MGFVDDCDRFCHWVGHCVNKCFGDKCKGFVESDDVDEREERLERTTY